MMTFEEIATKAEEVYGVYYDREEQFFICPECGEPLYKKDWGNNKQGMQTQCPVCEYEWDW